MHFLSSKIVGQLQTALKLILDPLQVKEGERKIEQLREQKCYQLVLATFISRSHSYDKKLLAIIEMEKLQSLQEEQTLWLLKQVYFKQNDKIANRIRKMLARAKNIRMIGEFLKVDDNICGSTVYRQIQFIFNLLKKKEAAEKVIQQYFSQLCQYFKKSITLLQAGQQSFFHFTVNLTQFYAYLAKTDSNIVWEKLFQHWKYMQKYYENGIQIETQLLMISIKNYLNILNVDYHRGTFYCVLSNIFKQLSRNNLQRLKFLQKTIDLFYNSGPILNNIHIREEFLEAILQNFKNQSKNLLFLVKNYGQTQMILHNQEFEEGYSTLVNQSCRKIAKSLLQSHSQWFFNHFLVNLGNVSKKYWIVLSLLLFIEKQLIENIKEQIPGIFHEIENQLERTLKSLKAKGFNEQKLSYCINILSILSRFKEEIQIKRLPSLIIFLLEASEDCQNLMPFCDSFTQLIWKELTFLQAQDLYSFLDVYLNNLNKNQWTVKVKSYQSIINISLYLEQSFQFFSTALSNEPLFMKSIEALRRICQMMEENSSSKVDHQFLQLFLDYTKAILSNRNISSIMDLSQHLKIPFLIHKIESLHLFSQTTAIIIAVYNFYSHTALSFKDWLQNFHILLKNDNQFCQNVYVKIMELASTSRSSEYVANYSSMIVNTISQSIVKLSSGSKAEGEEKQFWKQFVSRYSANNSQIQMMQIQRI